MTRNLDREPGFLLLVVMLLPFIAFGTVAVAFDRWRGAVR